MLATLLFLAAGFILLLKGADWLVDGSSSLAKLLGISELAIGLTVVAFGTSLPELIVNIYSAARGSEGIAFGNIIGSNIFNLLFILGVATLVWPLPVKKSTAHGELPYSFVAALLLFLLLLNGFLYRWDAAILFAFFLGFLYYIYKTGRVAPEKHEAFSPWTTVLLLLAGFAGLLIGGKLVVDNAVVLARSLGVTEALIGLTVVSVGTSLPELATSTVAAFKRRADIAVGNIIGSNIFNILFILSVSGLIRDLPYNAALNVDLLFLLFATAALFGLLFLRKKYAITRWKAFVLLGLYAIYLAFIIWRG